MASMPLSAGGEPSAAQASSAPTRRVSSRGKAPRNAYPESPELRARATGKRHYEDGGAEGGGKGGGEVRRLDLGVVPEEEEEVEEEEGGEGGEEAEEEGGEEEGEGEGKGEGEGDEGDEGGAGEEQGALAPLRF